MDLSIHSAAESDLEAIKNLLEENELPTKDLDQDNINLFVGFVDNNIRGVIGFEKYKNVGLLRSLAIKDLYKNQKIGTHLVHYLFDWCLSEQIDTLYLLTTTAEIYFTKFGFVKIDRFQVPYVIRETREFKDICPLSAVVMYKKMNL